MNIREGVQWEPKYQQDIGIAAFRKFHAPTKVSAGDQYQMKLVHKGYNQFWIAFTGVTTRASR